MYKSETFGRIFWVDDDFEFKSCPLNVDETGDFTCDDYVSEWTDWEGVDMNLLLAIHRCELLNKTQYAGSLTLNDKAHKVTDKKDDYADKVDRLVDNMKMNSYKYDEQFYNEIVKDSKFSFGKFNDPDYPIHLSQT
jgi:hypothetical protein